LRGGVSLEVDMHSSDDHRARPSFATRLRERRLQRADLPQSAMATAIGVEEEHYARYELGHTEPNLGTLLAICRVLDCTPNDLLL
jgi:DNA-binding XRE family transcriptional regulator